LEEWYVRSNEFLIARFLDRGLLRFILFADAFFAACFVNQSLQGRKQKLKAKRDTKSAERSSTKNATNLKKKKMFLSKAAEKAKEKAKAEKRGKKRSREEAEAHVETTQEKLQRFEATRHDVEPVRLPSPSPLPSIRRSSPS
jgi:hypothetical protein